MSLKPTPARLALLAAVRDGEVWFNHRNNASYLNDGARRKVTSRIVELRDAGWVWPSHQVIGWSEKWQLTTAGAEILDAGTTGGAS